MARTKREVHKHTSCKTMREQLSKEKAMARAKQMAYKHTSYKTLRDLLSSDEARTEPPVADRTKKPFQYKPGPVALREIKEFLQQSATKKKLHIPQLSFRRLVRIITQSLNPELRFQAVALDALQEAAEAYVIAVMEDPKLRAIHAKRVMDQVKDERLAKWLRGGETIGH